MNFEWNFNFDFKLTQLKGKNDRNILNNQNETNKDNDFKQKSNKIHIDLLKTK
jgi:hypothetical protein